MSRLSIRSGEWRIDVGFPPPEAWSSLLSLVISERAAEVMRTHYAEVERLILSGQNSVQLVYPPDAARSVTAARTVVYTVPSWGHHPIARTRVAWRRFKHRNPEFVERLLYALRWLGSPWGLTR